MGIITDLRQTIQQNNLISKGDQIVIGISGGPDSVCLCLVLFSLKKEYNLSLYLAHLDHRIRKASFKDRIFCQKFAKSLKLPFYFEEIDVLRQRRRASTEEIARNIRFEFLLRAVRRFRANKIALGHNLDDQAETVLMRILRGTGLSGLSGILPKRKIGKFTIIRPLIEIPRSTIETYLRRRRISPCVDESNLEDLYFRNRIRNKLLPFLEKEYNPNIKEILANMAQTTASDYNYLEQSAKRAFRKTEVKSKYMPKSQQITCSLQGLLRLHPAIARLALRLAIAQITGNMRCLEFRHLKELLDLFARRPVGSIVDLRGGIKVVKDKKTICISRK